LPGHELLSLGCSPRNPPHDAAVLTEGHLEVALLEPARAVHDLDPAGAEDRTRIAGTEGRERGQLRRHLLVDGLESQRAIDPNPRAEIVGMQAAIGKVVDSGHEAHAHDQTSW
jgi:hypothetical protein